MKMDEEIEVGEESLRRDFEVLSVSKRLVRSVSRKLRRKDHKGERELEEQDDSRGVSMKCLNLYSRGGGCKVGAYMSGEFGDPSSRRGSSASEEGKMYRTICGVEENNVDCFSYAMKERFWRKSNQKYIELGEPVGNSRMNVFLPDDILEMCLVRLPLTSLMNARLVCKRWKYLTTTSRFMQMRREGSYQSPWLFLFGTVKDGYCSREIHAFDISQHQWLRIDADILKGRFMFSVASIQDEIYIVGGCSSSANFGIVDRNSFKTHKGVLVFSPLTKSWRKVAAMKNSRSMPVLGVSEVTSDFMVIHSHQNRHYRRVSRSRISGVSDVYEDPHRLSVRRQHRNASDEFEPSFMYNNRKSYRLTRQRSEQSNAKGHRRFVLIAVGGLGSWDEPLDSGEIYDSVSNKWSEIQKLPLDFGIVCSGAVSKGMFYVYSETDKLAGYDIERGYWIMIQTSPFPPRVQEYLPKLVSCNGRLFMLSVSWCEGDGQIGQRNKAVRKLWELDLFNLTWAEVSVHPDAPIDWNAAYVVDKNRIFGIEMCKIFGQVLDFLTLCDVSDTGMNWKHIPRRRMTHKLDASSCVTKTMAVIHL